MPSNIARTAKGCWHDLDPPTRHAAKSAAQKDRSRLLGLQSANPKIKRRKACSGASRKALKGKGESSSRPVDTQIDRPARHGLDDVNAVDARNAALRDTVRAFGVK